MSENKNKYKTITGVFLIFFSALVFISMTSFLFNWQVDQSELDEIISSTEDIQNFGKKIGLIISNLLIFKGFGIGSFVFPLLFSFYGLSLLINSFTKKLIDISINALVICVWTSISLSYLIENKIFGGVFGYEIHIILLEYIGDLGLILLLLFVLFSFIILNFNINFKNFLKGLKKINSREIGLEFGFYCMAGASNKDKANMNNRIPKPLLRKPTTHKSTQDFQTKLLKPNSKNKGILGRAVLLKRID